MQHSAEQTFLNFQRRSFSNASATVQAIGAETIVVLYDRVFWEILFVGLFLFNRLFENSQNFVVAHENGGEQIFFAEHLGVFVPPIFKIFVFLFAHDSAASDFFSFNFQRILKKIPSVKIVIKSCRIKNRKRTCVGDHAKFFLT